MKIGILSDTHNNLENLHAGLEIFRQNDVTTVIHCGDFTGVEIARALQGFRVISVFGNGDAASGEIRQVLLAQNPENYAALIYSGAIDGARIAVAHGHVPGTLDELVRSGRYDYVFKGHSHQHQDERVGFTRLINPGSLGGLHREERRVCMLDLASGEARFLVVTG